MELLLAGDRRRQPLDKIRADRLTTLEQIETVSEATLSLDETVARLLARLGDEADRAQHRVLAFGHPSIVPDLPVVNAGFLLWLNGADFEKQLRARLKALLPNSAMSQPDRAKKLASLRARLVELEEAEEREICRLEGQGVAVERRIDVEVGPILKVWDERKPGAAPS